MSLEEAQEILDTWGPVFFAERRVLEAAKAWGRHPHKDTIGWPLRNELLAAIKELEELENERTT